MTDVGRPRAGSAGPRRPGRAAGRARAALLVALALPGAVGGAAGAAAQDFPVGPSDLLRLRVLDWDALEGEVREWPDLSGEYVVGPDGAIVVPFAGRIVAEGRRTEEVAADVVEALRNRLALIQPPDATVEIAAWRPVIVTGDVRNPGPYDFSPGMLATQAIGLAGGTGAALGDTYLRREAASAETNLLTLRSQEQRQVARRARLEAELAGRDTVVAEPPQGATDWTAVVELEQQLLRIRRDRLARELAAIDEQVQLLSAEIEALDRQSANLAGQLELAAEAAANAEELASQGLVAQQRIFESRQVRSSIENQLLDVSTATLRARQGIAGAERERIALQDARAAETLEQRQQVDGELAETRARIAGQIAILEALQAEDVVDLLPEPEVAVLRLEDGALRRIEDATLEPLRPGDMVEVSRPRASPAVALAGALGEAPAPSESPAPVGAPSEAPAAEAGPAGEAPGGIAADPAAEPPAPELLGVSLDAGATPAAPAPAAPLAAPPEATPSPDPRPAAGVDAQGPGGQAPEDQAPQDQQSQDQGLGTQAPGSRDPRAAQAAEAPAARVQPMTEPPSVSPVARPG